MRCLEAPDVVCAVAAHECCVASLQGAAAALAEAAGGKSGGEREGGRVEKEPSDRGRNDEAEKDRLPLSWEELTFLRVLMMSSFWSGEVRANTWERGTRAPRHPESSACRRPSPGTQRSWVTARAAMSPTSRLKGSLVSSSGLTCAIQSLLSLS